MSAQLPTACADTDLHLVALAFGEESGVPASARTHLASCVRCQGALAELEETRAFAGALPLEEPSSALDDRIFAALDAHLDGEDVSRFLTQPEPQSVSSAAERPALRLAASSPAPSAASPVAAPSAKPRRRLAPWMYGVASTLALAAGVALVVRGSADFSTHSSPQAAAVPMAPAAAKVAAPAPVMEDAPAETAQPKAEGAAPAQTVALAEKPAEPPPPPPVAATARSAEEKVAKDSAAVPGDKRAEALADDVEPAPKKRALQQVGRAGAASANEAALDVDLSEERAKADAPLVGAGGDSGGGLRASGVPYGGLGGFTHDLEAQRKPMAVAQPAAQAPVRSAPAAPAPALASTAPVPQRMIAAQDESESLQPAAKKGSSSLLWELPLAQARAAAQRGDWTDAAVYFKKVLAQGDLPDEVTIEALTGRVDALLQTGSLDEAERVAQELSRRFPGHLEPRLRVIRARNRSPSAVDVGAAGNAVPADRR